MPYDGVYKGVTWNSRGLLAYDLAQQHHKRTYLEQLITQHDFIALQETHSTPGAVGSIQLPDKTTAMWSHCSRRQGGVALIIKEVFLRQFSAIRQADWVEPLAGRVAALHLTGPHGSISIAVAYFPSGHGQEGERQHARRCIRELMESKPHALWIVMGDFNYVTKDSDRYCLHTQTFSGAKDNNEEEHWKEHVAGPKALVELTQPSFTFQSATVRSRLDRVYVNHHAADWFRGTIYAAALPWPPPQSNDERTVSDHRPVSFGRQLPPAEGRPPMLREKHIKHKDFPKRVSRSFHEDINKRLGNGQTIDAVQKLQLLKEAMHRVNAAMEETNYGATYLESNDSPNTAATAFGIIAAIERGTLTTVDKVRSRLPEEWVSAVCPSNGSLRQSLQVLKSKALELTKNELLNDMRELQSNVGEPDEQSRQIRQNSINRRLANLGKKATNKGIFAMHDGNGQVYTQAEDMARLLQEHWQKVFKDKNIDDVKLSQWMAMAREVGAKKVESAPAAWRVRTRDIRKALKMAGNSRPGPDGIPFEAWRRLGAFGEHMLWEAGRYLETGLKEGQPGHDSFNESFLCCLPKTASYLNDQGEQVYEAKNTRPLTITNTDNRIIASAYRIRWEPLIAPVVAKNQRGFIGGRSMLCNVIDIEHEAIMASLDCEDAVIILFDFTAAFPSISRKFMREAATAAGLPVGAMAVFDSLYYGTVSQMLFHGQLYGHVPLDSGIRQGCPLSPLLFALATDSLLRIIEWRHPAAVTRAFADDTAVVLRSWSKESRRIFNTFYVFGTISNLELNYSKTMIIPLWASGEKVNNKKVEDTNKAFDPENPPLANSTILDDEKWDAIKAKICWSSTGKYLGFYVGPGKGHKSWEKPMQKYKERLGDWQWGELGLHQALAVYGTYILPVLTYVAQLEVPPPEALCLEDVAARKVAPGPAAWCSVKDLHHGHELGLDRTLRPLSISCSAAMLRIHAWENRADGGIPWRELANALEIRRRATEQIYRVVSFQKWFDMHIPTVVFALASNAAKKGIHIAAARKDLCGDHEGQHCARKEKKLRKGTQKCFSKHLLTTEGFDPITRIRKRMEH